MPAYNGHRSRNAWNVSLWISNDEGLYRAAVDCLKSSQTLGGATRRMLAIVGEGSRTPDGAVYNATCVREALSGLKECL